MQINLVPDLSLPVIVVIFFLNYLVVRRFFLKPLNDIIESRETEAATAERLYEESLARFNEATSRMEEQLHSAKREAGSIREKFRADASQFRQQTVERTQGEAKTIIGTADETLKKDVAQAREKLKRDTEALAKLAAERILGRAV